MKFLLRAGSRSILTAGCLLAATLAVAHAVPRSAVQIEVHIYRLSSPLDVNSIKAIGSAQTKASPSILHVDNVEAERVAKISGGTLVGAPKILTKLGQTAKIATSGAPDSYTIEVTPSTKSDMISLDFTMEVTLIEDEHRKVTRTARGSGRVLETKSLLVVLNPRGNHAGILAVFRAKRVGKPQ